MNEIRVFENERFGEVRTVMQDGEPWFVATDVCRALDIDATAARRLDKDDIHTLRLAQGDGVRTSATNVVNEPGLYTLVLGSRKPEARAFKRWVTHDVLPAIRKTGMYATSEALADNELAAVLATALKHEQERSEKLAAENALLRGRGQGGGAGTALLTAAESFVAAVTEMAARGELRVERLGGEEIRDPDGYEDERYLYMRPARTYERVRELNERLGRPVAATPKTLYKSLRTSGCVEPDDHGGTATRIKQVRGRSQRLLWVRKQREGNGHA